MYVLETDDLCLGVWCDGCMLSATLEVDDPSDPDHGVRFELLNCPDCGHVRMVRLS